MGFQVPEGRVPQSGGAAFAAVRLRNPTGERPAELGFLKYLCCARGHNKKTLTGQRPMRV